MTITRHRSTRSSRLWIFNVQIRLGSGLTDAEVGIRLRYEITRRFAPYIGVSYEAKTGRTADYARADGKYPTTTSFVAGVRLQF